MRDANATGSAARFDTDIRQRPAAQRALDDPNYLHRKQVFKRQAHERDSVQHYVEMVAWLAAAAAAVYYSDIINVTLSGEALIGTWWWFCVACWLGFAGIGFYQSLYLPYVKGIKPNETDDPVASRPIQIASGLLVIGGLAWTVAYWPAYGWLTPALGFVLFMGGLMLLQLIPSW